MSVQRTPPKIEHKFFGAVPSGLSPIFIGEEA